MTKSHKVTICLTVDWEGEHFKNIYDLKSLMHKYAGDVPVTHFICPAYFSSGYPQAKKRISDVIKKTDEIALHLHCYRSLIEYCGIEFKTDHNYYKRELYRLLSSFPAGIRNYLQKNLISGRGIPPGVYSNSEIDTILSGSLELLKTNLNITDVSGFRAGGWLLRDAFFPLLKKHGVFYDSSAVPPEILSRGYSGKQTGNGLDDYGQTNGYFTTLVTKLWGGHQQTEQFLYNQKIVTATNHQPVKKTTGPFMIEDIMEMPNNGGMSDFASVDKTLIPLLHSSIDSSEKTGQPVFINFGCHQEGQAAYKLAVADFLEYLRNYRDNIEFMTVYQASRKAKKNC